MKQDDLTRMVEQILTNISECKDIPDDTPTLMVAGGLIVSGLLLAKEEGMTPSEAIVKLIGFVESVYSVEVRGANNAIIFYADSQESQEIH